MLVTDLRATQFGGEVMPKPRADEFPHVICRQFLLLDPIPGERILDVGCGKGELMKECLRAGCIVVGTEISPPLIESGRADGLDVRQGLAESLPFEDNSFDRVLCSVVVPYTNEAKAISEWARIIRPGGRAIASYHGVGYALHQIFRAKGMRIRIYGMRTLLNTYYYWATGRRLPGFLGDALCQSIHRLRKYYRTSGLTLERELVVDSFGNYPRFLCHQLRKPAESSLNLIPRQDNRLR